MLEEVQVAGSSEENGDVPTTNLDFRSLKVIGEVDFPEAGAGWILLPDMGGG